jgi:DNA-binding response OmpR family regulator
VVKAVTTNQVPGEESIYGNLTIDERTFAVTVKGSAVYLTFFEFELLRTLCRQVDRIVNYDALCQALWHSEGPRERRRLNVAICRLRTKLSASWPYQVQTVRGRGYGLIADRRLGPPSLKGAI